MRIATASIVRLVPSLAAACLTAGCVLAVGGAALGTAIVATDRRSVGIQLEDAEIEHRVNSSLDAHFTRTSVRIDVTSYNLKVLLAGQVPRDQDRADAEELARHTQGVTQVTNDLSIGSLAGLASTVDDSMLAGKVRSALLQVPDLPNGAVKVACTDGNIYLFGRVGADEAELAKRATSHINGVKRVVALFEILTEAELADFKRAGEAPKGKSVPNATSP